MSPGLSAAAGRAREPARSTALFGPHPEGRRVLVLLHVFTYIYIYIPEKGEDESQQRRTDFFEVRAAITQHLLTFYLLTFYVACLLMMATEKIS